MEVDISTKMDIWLVCGIRWAYTNIYSGDADQGIEAGTEDTREPDGADLFIVECLLIWLRPVTKKVFSTGSCLEEAWLLEALDTCMVQDALGASVTLILESKVYRDWDVFNGDLMVMLLLMVLVSFECKAISSTSTDID